jgi:hypothetical protein
MVPAREIVQSEERNIKGEKPGKCDIQPFKSTGYRVTSRSGMDPGPFLRDITRFRRVHKNPAK